MEATAGARRIFNPVKIINERALPPLCLCTLSVLLLLGRRDLLPPAPRSITKPYPSPARARGTR
jgi:hypothetical protein